MHSNVFSKVPPRQIPFSSPTALTASLFRFRLLKTPSNLPSLQRKRWSDATAWVYRSWFAFSTIIGSDIPQELPVAKPNQGEKKKKEKNQGAAAQGDEYTQDEWDQWMQAQSAGITRVLDLLVVIFTTTDPQDNGDWWAVYAMSIRSLVISLMVESQKCFGKGESAHRTGNALAADHCNAVRLANGLCVSVYHWKNETESTTDSWTRWFSTI